MLKLTDKNIKLLMLLHDVDDVKMIHLVEGEYQNFLCYHETTPLHVSQTTDIQHSFGSVDVHVVRMEQVQIAIGHNWRDLGYSGKCSCGKLYISER